MKRDVDCEGLEPEELEELLWLSEMDVAVAVVWLVLQSGSKKVLATRPPSSCYRTHQHSQYPFFSDWERYADRDQC